MGLQTMEHCGFLSSQYLLIRNNETSGDSQAKNGSTGLPEGSAACDWGRPLRVRSTGSTANPAGVEEPVAGTRYRTSMIAASPGVAG